MASDSKHVIVLDLDGSLCNCLGRVEYARAGQWDEFHSRLVDDEPNEDVAAVVRALSAQDYCILAVTGRNEKYRVLTHSWLTNHAVPVDMVLMRGDTDFRQDAVLKIELLEQHFGGKESVLAAVLFAIEDRDGMTAAWRDYGIPAWQVRAGSY